MNAEGAEAQSRRGTKAGGRRERAFSSPDAAQSVVIEDNGRVAYAYLTEAGRITGDVWLYNIAEPRDTPEWTLPDARERMPFLNPPGLAGGAPAVDLERDLDVRWRWSGSGETIAGVLVRGELWAVLAAGKRPGWNRFAIRAGPLAIPLVDCPHRWEGAR